MNAQTDSPASVMPVWRKVKLWLWLGRGVWLLLALFSFITFLAGIRTFYTSLLNFPNSATGFSQWTPQAMAIALDNIGISVADFAALETGLAIYKFLVYGGLALFLFIKRSHSVFALYVSLLMFLTGTFWGFNTLTPLTPFLMWVNRLIYVLLFTGMFSLLYLFPNGRFAPKWSLVLAPLWFLFLLAAFILIDLFRAGQLTSSSAVLQAVSLLLSGCTLLGIIGLVASMGIAQVYRYRYVSTPLEREQSKWFMFAALLNAVLLLVFGAAIPALYPDVNTVTATGLRYGLLVNTLSAIAWTCLPIAIAIALLRYRLWDIDLLINRTMVYVPLTGILSGIFAVSSDWSKQFLADLTGGAANGAVIATLLVVATFDPLKKGIEGFVERVFKEPPDPTKHLQAYSAQVGNVMQVMDVEQSARRLLDETVTAFGAQGGKIVIGPVHSPRLTYTHGDWTGEAALTFVLDHDDLQVGTLFLGPRKNERPYTAQDQALLEKYLAPVELAMVWAERAQSQEPEAPE
ncbi:MAG: hypothetical protein HY741_11370 [Chloroflexi bacterium]|nr:hypothetical protein [Chloroflexota bacterium]